MIDKSDSARKFNEMHKKKGMILVLVADLEELAGLHCNYPKGGECKTYDINRGSCCNSCWTARWAKRQLERTQKNPRQQT